MPRAAPYATDPRQTGAPGPGDEGVPCLHPARVLINLLMGHSTQHSVLTSAWGQQSGSHHCQQQQETEDNVLCPTLLL